MFEKLIFNENNERILCEMNGKHSDMLMNIKVKRFNAGEAFNLFDNDCETAFLILYGDVDISWNGETKNMRRETPFVKATYCLHVPKQTEVTIKANKETKTSLEEQINAYDYASAVISSGISENSEEYKKAIQMLKDNNYEFIGETLENVNKVTESTDENTQKQQTFWGRIVDKVKDVNKNVDDLSSKKATINVDVNKENFEKNINSIKKTNIVLDALLKFKTDNSNVNNAVSKIVNSFTNALPSTFKKILGITGYAEGGFPEDGWFRASKGELIGQFDDGTSMVANNKQVVAGVREMLKDGMMDALMMANNTNKQNVNVTIIAEDNDMLNGIKFKEKQRDRQYGF